MLRYSALGSKILLGLFAALAGVAIYLPFLEGFALTPAVAFIHRFSITLNIGSDTKTLQPIIFIIPILLIKGIWEYQKRYSLTQLLKSNLMKLVAILVIADIISIATSTARGSSIGIFLTHGMNLAIFITSSIWLKLIYDLLEKEKLRKFGIKLLKTFSIALIGFTVLNAIVSVTQFFDCSLSTTGCHMWNKIDEVFPNKLLAVGHQKFAYKPVVIRAPGFFGDVNFNGMFSLFIVLISGTLLVISELIKTPKGYIPTKEQRLLLVPLIAGLLSFTLTLSRSALLGTAVTGVIFLVILIIPLVQKIGITKELSLRVAKFSAISITAAELLFAMGYLVPLTYNTRKTTLSKEIVLYVRDMFKPEEDSAQGHADLFVSAVKIGNQNPLFGTGLGTFGVQYEKLIRPGSGTNANPHSTYGMLYAEQGLVGVGLYLIAIGTLWYLSIKAAIKTVRHLLQERIANKKVSKDFYAVYGARLLLILICFGIPYFSIATISYYGFFLPMAWWWGNGELLKS